MGLFTNPVMNLWALAAVAFLLTVIYVPYANHLVRLTPLPFISFLLVVGIVIVVMFMLEFKKFLTRPLI